MVDPNPTQAPTSGRPPSMRFRHPSAEKLTQARFHYLRYEAGRTSHQTQDGRSRSCRTILSTIHPLPWRPTRLSSSSPVTSWPGSSWMLSTLPAASLPAPQRPFAGQVVPKTVPYRRLYPWSWCRAISLRMPFAPGKGADRPISSKKTAPSERARSFSCLSEVYQDWR